VRGDGNCYYRAVAFSFFENMINGDRTQEAKVFVKRYPSSFVKELLQHIYPLDALNALPLGYGLTLTLVASCNRLTALTFPLDHLGMLDRLVDCVRGYIRDRRWDWRGADGETPGPQAGRESGAVEDHSQSNRDALHWCFHDQEFDLVRSCDANFHCT
jgi:hypothetical protein